MKFSLVGRHTLIIYILNSFLKRVFSKIEGKCDPIPKNISYKIINQKLTQ